MHERGEKKPALPAGYPMSLIKDIARQGKDKVLSRALEVLGRKVVSRYGTLCDITLDSLDRKIEIEVLLEGESIPIRISINRFDIVFEGGEARVIFRDIAVSRAWMKTLAEDILEGRALKIPRKYAKLLDKIAQHTGLSPWAPHPDRSKGV
jgi:hypothetical protein